MKSHLNNLNKELKDLINLAQGIAYSHNWPVYLVGGFVRDLILEVKNFDLDIAVEGDGIKFAEDFSAKLKARFIRHKRFGTATVTINPVLKVDIATARKEFYPQPASLPVVSSGTLKDDLFRRDFTINAMAISIAKKDFGRLIDFFAGRDALRHLRHGRGHSATGSGRAGGIHWNAHRQGVSPRQRTGSNRGGHP